MVYARQRTCRSGTKVLVLILKYHFVKKHWDVLKYYLTIADTYSKNIIYYNLIFWRCGMDNINTFKIVIVISWLTYIPLFIYSINALIGINLWFYYLLPIAYVVARTTYVIVYNIMHDVINKPID